MTSQIVSAARLAELVGGEPFDSPVWRDVTERIRMLVTDGRVSDGTRLPSERELAAALRLSRTTTTRVYAELRELGLLHSRRGSGSVVRVPLAASSVSSLIIDPRTPGDIAMTYSAPSGPPGIARAFAAAAEQLPGLLATTGYLPDGLPVLRELLAERYASQGMPTGPEQIIVTNGAMGAISLAARTMLRPGSRGVVEAVSYPHAHDAMRAAGARLSVLPAADDPWDTAALSPLLRGGRHDVAYLIPDFHNPTGLVMSTQTRETWARELRRHDVLALVDESLREVNLDGIELPEPFGVHDRRAITIGSASKEFWGGLRVGWARVPEHLVVPMLQSRMSLDLGSSAFEQLVVADLIAHGGGIADQRRHDARAARDHLVRELARRLPDVQVRVPSGGLNLWLTLPERVSTRLVAAASRHGLLLTPGPRFFAGRGGEQHLRLPYTLEPHVLTEAVDRLVLAWGDLAGSGRTTSTPAPIDLIA